MRLRWWRNRTSSRERDLPTTPGALLLAPNCARGRSRSLELSERRNAGEARITALLATLACAPVPLRGSFMPRLVQGGKSAWNAISACIAEWHRRMRSRHELMRLDEHELGDIRMTSADARYEASKPFWKK